MNGRAFDAQVVQTDINSERGKLLQQYVCARVSKLNGIDVGHFDFDRHNALYFFIINADEEIYLRYGGRDSESASTYLNLRSLELALKKGLELHADKSWRPVDPRPTKLLPKDIKPLANHVKKRFLCVECHMVADYQAIVLEREGKLDRIRDLYVSPDIKTIGFHLDVPKGLLIKNVDGAAEAAGILPGDLITHLNGKPVYTFADFQYRYGKVDRNAESIEVTVSRDKTRRKLTIQLPALWWLTEIGYRRWTVEPLMSFRSRPLDSDLRKKRSLPRNSIASEITYVEESNESTDPPLKVGDLILEVNGNGTDEIADHVDLHIKLRYSSGDTLNLLVERNGKQFNSRLRTTRQNFRKGFVEPGEWTTSGSTEQGEASFEAELIGEYLVVRAKHAKGWHTYSMDNEVRAQEAAGDAKLLGVEQGLSIKATGGVKLVSRWRQTEPKEFSDLGQKWFSFGFDGQAFFACKVESAGAKDVLVHISGQTCNSKTCRPVNVNLRIPNVKKQLKGFNFNQLVEVKTKPECKSILESTCSKRR